MGGEESTLTPSPFSILDDDIKHNRIVPIDQRDYPKDWKRDGHSFIYFVDTRIANSRETLKKVIYTAGNRLFYNDNPRDSKIEFILNEKEQDIISDLSIFRLRMGKQYFVGIATQIPISSNNNMDIYDELYPMPSDDMIKKKIQEIVNAGDTIDDNIDDSEMIKDPDIHMEVNNNNIPNNNNNNDITNISSNQRIKTLQPSSESNGKTYICISVQFDPDKALQYICPRIFESLISKHWNNENIDENGNIIPSVFVKLGKDISDIKNDLKIGKLGKLDLKTGKLKYKISDNIDGFQYTQLEEEKDNFLGVNASKATRILGFLEQPWKIVIPNIPVVNENHVKRLLEQWQAYSKRFMIKLTWMQLIREPKFIKISKRILKVDLPYLKKEDEKLLLPYYLEFWNKPEMNYHWKMSLKRSDTTVAIWKTKMYFYRDEENGSVCLFKNISVPIWSVVDEESMKHLLLTKPITLQSSVYKYIISCYPKGKIYHQNEAPSKIDIPKKEKLTSLADFEKQIHSSSSLLNNIDLDSDSESDDIYSSDYSNDSNNYIIKTKYTNNKITLNNLPSSLITEIFHTILSLYGVQPEIEKIFGNLNSIQGLYIPYVFQKQNTRADFKAESLIVMLGSIATTFTYLNLSKCTLSAESLNSLCLKNLLELNLSYCSGIMEWYFLLSMKENLRELRLSSLKQCGNGEQLCSIIGQIENLQILDISNTKLCSAEKLLFQLTNLSSLTNLNIQHDDEGLWCITDNLLYNIIEIKTLRTLYLPGHYLSPTSIYQLVELPYLFDLGFSNLIGIGKHSPLATLTQLTSLSIVHSEIYDNSIEGIIGVLTGLTRLNLSNNEITGEGICALAQMTGLRSLNLADNQVGLNRNQDHFSFACITQLTYLDLSGNPIINMRPWMSRKQRLLHLSFLLKMTQLRTLKMDKRKSDEYGIEDNALNYFRQITNLTSLSLKQQSLSDSFSRYISRFSFLEILDIGQNNITNECIKELSKLQHLHTLYAQDTVLSDASLVYLTNLPKLKNVYLSNTRITPNAISILQKQCPHISIII